MPAMSPRPPSSLGAPKRFRRRHATSVDVQQGDDLREAMRRGRLAVENYFDEISRALGEPVWSEPDATSRLLLAAQPEARFIPFNPREEGGSSTRTGVGSDWMWWIAPTGVCFGMLIQAKNLKRSSAGGPSICSIGSGDRSPTCSQRPTSWASRPPMRSTAGQSVTGRTCPADPLTSRRTTIDAIVRACACCRHCRRWNF